MFLWGTEQGSPAGKGHTVLGVLGEEVFRNGASEIRAC